MGLHSLAYSIFPSNLLCRKFKTSKVWIYKVRCHQMCKPEKSAYNSWRFFWPFMHFFCIHAVQMKSFALITLTKHSKTSSTKNPHLSLTFSQPHNLLNYLFWNSGLRRRLHVKQMHSQNTVKERASKRGLGYLCDQLMSTHTVRDSKQNYLKTQLCEKVSQSPCLSQGLKDSFFQVQHLDISAVVLCFSSDM